jgi:hypothetical protein
MAVNLCEAQIDQEFEDAISDAYSREMLFRPDADETAEEHRNRMRQAGKMAANILQEIEEIGKTRQPYVGCNIYFHADNSLHVAAKRLVDEVLLYSGEVAERDGVVSAIRFGGAVVTITVPEVYRYHTHDVLGSNTLVSMMDGEELVLRRTLDPRLVGHPYAVLYQATPDTSAN